jgi:RHS repeat-associated protein
MLMAYIARLLQIATGSLLFLAFHGYAADAVGITRGVHGVSRVGAAQYSVPLNLPSDRLTPAISLSYDHQRPDGLLGMGFAITGFSTIQRCPHTAAQDVDRAAGGALLESTDAYCLDGNRLRLTNGTYGADGSTYQTEVETFALVKALGTTPGFPGGGGGGPQKWEVWTRDGLIHEYGATADSRIESAGTSTPRLWALNRIRDRVGNYIDFTYIEDTANGSYRPNEIRYAGSTALGIAPSTRVVFVYETATRPDPIYAYRFGVEGGGTGVIVEFKRLDRIDIIHDATSQPVRTYEMSYEPTGGAGGRSRIATIQECASGDCLAALSLQWVNGTANWAAEIATTVAIPTTALVVDFDNDGQEDMLYSSTTTSGTGKWFVIRGSNSGYLAPLDTGAVNWNFANAQAIEWDGDGTADLLVPCSNGTTWCVFYQKIGTSPNKTFATTPFDTGIAISAGGTSGPNDWLGVDISGDGLSDLVRIDRTPGQQAIRSRVRDPRSGVPPFFFEQLLFGYSSLIVDFSEALAAKRLSSVRRIDSDGDGVEDFYFETQDAGQIWTNVYYSSGRGVSSFANPGSAFVYPGDFNGDGLTDFAFAGSNWLVQLSRGGTFAQLVGPSAANLTRALMADYDSDGRSDILMTTSSSTTWLYARGTGAGFGALTDSGLVVGATVGATVTDVNGDGLHDLAAVNPSAGNSWKFRLHNGVQPDLLDRVTDGYGNFVDFEYRSTPMDNFYAGLEGILSYPSRLYNGPMTLVQAFNASDGIGGTYTVSYTYSTGGIDLQGRGFLGFRQRVSLDTRDQRATQEVYAQHFPYIGIQQLEAVTASGRTTHRILRDLAQHNYGSISEPRHFPYVSHSTDERYDYIAGASQVISRTSTFNSVDVWGTVTDTTATTEELSSGLFPGTTHTRRTWHPVVTNDTANWCLGKPAETRQINSHTQPGGAQITRTTTQAWNTLYCRLTSTVVEPGDPSWQVTTSIGYDGRGNINSVTTTPAAGQGQPARTTTIDWGTSGRFPLTVTNPKSQAMNFGWDALQGLRTSATDANNLQIEWHYDAFGRVIRIDRPDDTATDLNFTWCNTAACQAGDANRRTQVQEIARDALNNVITDSRSYFDSYEREIWSQAKALDGQYSTVRSIFNARGLLQQRSMPYLPTGSVFYTTYTYDHRGRPTLIRRPTSDGDASNHDTAFAYEGFKTVATDALTHSTTTYMSAVGLTVQTLDALGQDTDYEYDAFGNLLRTRDVLGSETVLTYNVRGMKMSSNDPDMGPWTYSYYPLGELKSQTDAKNQTTTFTYDELSRPLTRVMPEGAGSITSTFGWGDSAAAHNIGQLEWMQIAGTGVTTYRETYAYDALGRRSQVTYAEGATNYFVNYAYNANTGFLEQITYPTSTSGFRMPLLYEYQNGLPSRVSSGGTQWWVATAADALGNVTDETLGDPTTGVAFRTQSSHDLVTGQLESRQATYTSGSLVGTVLANLGFLHDRVGNLIQRQDNQQGLTENFYYDNLSRLDSSTLGTATTDYSYDARGNLTAKTGAGTLYSYTATVAGCTYYSHAQVHAVRRITGGSSTMNFCYDANGNMTNRNGTSLTWFANNLPKAITKDANNSSTFEYTPTGQRWRHVYRSAGGNYTHTYIGTLFEKVVGPTTTDFKHYVQLNGQAIGVYIRRANGAKSSHYFVKDHIGSIAAVSISNGSWTLKESFDAFGARRGPAWTGSPTASDLAKMNDTTRRGFTFHEHMDSTGLINMNGRVYDPQIGRFVSADPIVQAPYYSQSLNRYSYLFNNPLSGSDPSGFMGPGCTSADGGDACGGGLGSNMFNFNFIINGWFYVNSLPFNSLGNLLDLYWSINLNNLDLSSVCTGPSGENLCVIDIPSLPPIPIPPIDPGSPVPPGPPSPPAAPPPGPVTIVEGTPASTVPGIMSAGPLAGMMIMPLPPVFVTMPGTPNRRAALAGIVSSLEVEVINGTRTSLSAFIFVAQSASIYATDGTTYVNDLASVLSGTSTTNVGTPQPGFRTPAFGDSGFRREYQDGSNQVRHFVGAMVAGAAFGSALGQILNTGREIQSAGNVADIRMGNLAAHLGAQLAAGRITPSEFAERLRLELSP